MKFVSETDALADRAPMTREDYVNYGLKNVNNEDLNIRRRFHFLAGSERSEIQVEYMKSWRWKAPTGICLSSMKPTRESIP